MTEMAWIIQRPITPKEYRTPQLGFSYNLGYTKTSGLRILKYGALEIKYMIRTTLLSLKELVTGQLGFQNLSGPVGVRRCDWYNL